MAFSIFPPHLVIRSQKKGEELDSESPTELPYILLLEISFFFSTQIYDPFPPHFLRDPIVTTESARTFTFFRISIVIPDCGFFSSIERIKYWRMAWKKKTMLNADVGAIARSHFIRIRTTKGWK